MIVGGNAWKGGYCGYCGCEDDSGAEDDDNAAELKTRKRTTGIWEGRKGGRMTPPTSCSHNS